MLPCARCLIPLTLVCPFLVCAEEADDGKGNKPAWQRLLEGDDAKLAADLQKRVEAAENGDKYDQAIKTAEDLLALRTRAQGADHWDTVNQKWEVDRLRRLQALTVEDRAAWRQALQAAVEAQQLDAKAKYAQAEPLWKQFVERCQNVFGEKFPTTARSYNQLGLHFYMLGKYADAQPLFQKAADIQTELLGENHPDSANAYSNLAVILNAQGKYAEAEPALRKTLAMLLAILGENNPGVATGHNNLAVNLNAQGKYAAAEPHLRRSLAIQRQSVGEKQLATALSYNNLAVVLGAQAKYAEAESLLQKALEIRLELLGEQHPDVAASYSSLAANLIAQGKYSDAGPLLRKALDIQQQRFGEKHPDVAKSYHNLAYVLKAQGKYADAEVLARRALALATELNGENHPDAALAYNNLAFIFDAQGRYADAQPLLEKGLEIQLKLLGAGHPDTATSYSNLAHNLQVQGKPSEAQQLYETALEIQVRLLGETHPSTVLTYNNLADNLQSQGDYAAATRLFEKAVALRLKLWGEKHPDTITSYNNLANNLDVQGKHTDAESLFEKVLKLRRESLGEKHPDTAASYNNLATVFYAQGKYAEALPLFQEALDLRRQLLGEKHPALATGYVNLARVLLAEQRFADALPLLERAAASYEAARLAFATEGLDRAVFGAERSPYPALAATRAVLEAEPAAWTAAETDLARGLSDEAAARRGALTEAESGRRLQVAARLPEVHLALSPLVSKPSLNEEETEQLGKLRHERDALETELAELAVAVSQREVATLAEVQRAIPSDGALLLWIDTGDQARKRGAHWGCVVRRSGEPHWEPLPGSGAQGEWSNEDSRLPTRLAAAAAGTASAAEIDALASRLHVQRLAPLEKHLAVVQRLFVVPVGEMAGVPAELFSDRYTVSYALSGTILARMNERTRPSGAALLALGDPVLPVTDASPQPPGPPGGLLMTHILPGSNAAQSGLEPDDVLLNYAGTSVASFEELGKLIQQHLQDASLEVLVWREGKTLDYQVRPGKLGVVIDRQPAAEAIAVRRKTAGLLAGLRGGGWKELPGTAVEVNRLRTLAGDEHATVLTRSSASEQELEQLRIGGKLEQFRYLHFATHGEPNNAKLFESALILSQDNLSKDIPIGGGKYYDGRLTANEVLENWKLNADLVTLSACESALGRPGGGDGLLGFAQAFLLAGARSVCLSLWKVDDKATALLMDRFYQNLLGKRDGLSQPMPKAEALAEAKRWLRDLTFDEATKLTADLTGGITRGKDESPLILVVPAVDSSAAKPDDRPFAHPRFWAAFILIGDPS